ncbi:MAG: diguanylate cyclase [Candidatus Hydrogenedentota bacterium]|nr:MAG: diguanylate cyclase [Candidatus Hydrogenedentota bacterium]
MKSLSVSAVMTYRQCPARFSFRYRDRLSIPEKESGDEETWPAIRTVLQQWLAFPQRDWDFLDRCLVDLWPWNRFSRRRDAVTTYHRSRALLWKAFPILSHLAPSETFRYVNISWAGGFFRALIDYAKWDDRDFVVGRFARTHPDTKAEEFRMNLYGAVAEVVHGRRPTMLQTFVLGDEPTIIDHQRLEPARLEQEIRALRLEIAEAREFPARPGAQCRFCSYRWICPESGVPVRTQDRFLELFALNRALTILLEGEGDSERFGGLMEKAVKMLSERAAVLPIEECRGRGWPVPPEGTILEYLGPDRPRKREMRPSDNVSEEVPLVFARAFAIGTRWVAFFEEGTSGTACETLRQALELAWERTRWVSRALRDPLTGLLNRGGFDSLLRELTPPSSLILFDIDRFKRINDTFGHQAGDLVLRSVAQILSEVAEAVGFRYGGEEMALVLPGASLETAQHAAERVRRDVEALQLSPVEGRTVSVTISAGVAEILAGEYPEDFLKRADKALYSAKDAGRNRVIVAAAPASGS